VNKIGFARLGRNNITPHAQQDIFSTNVAAGSLNNRSAEPGPGVLAVVDTTSLMSIVSNHLLINGGKGTPSYTDPRVNYTSLTRLAGRALFFDVTLSATNAFVRLGWSTTTTNTNGEAVILFNSSGQVNVFSTSSDNALDGTYSAATLYHVCILLRTTGASFFIRSAAYPKWTMLPPSNVGATTPLFPSIFNHSAITVVDDWDIQDLPALQARDQGRNLGYMLALFRLGKSPGIAPPRIEAATR